MNALPVELLSTAQRQSIP